MSQHNIYCGGLRMTVTVTHKWKLGYHLVRFPFGVETKVGINCKYRNKPIDCDANAAFAAIELLEKLPNNKRVKRALLTYVTDPKNACAESKKWAAEAMGRSGGAA